MFNSRKKRAVTGMLCTKCGVEAVDDVCPQCGEAAEGTAKWYVQQVAVLGDQQEYDRAHQLLTEGLQQYPTSALLKLNAGVLEEMRGNSTAAITHYQELLVMRPNSKKAQEALDRLLAEQTGAGDTFAAPGPISLAGLQPEPASLLAAPPEPVTSDFSFSHADPADAGGTFSLPDDAGMDLASLPEFPDQPLSKAEAKRLAKEEAKARAAAEAAAKAEAKAAAKAAAEAARANKATKGTPPVQLPDGVSGTIVLPSQIAFSKGARLAWKIIARLCSILAITGFLLMVVFLVRQMGFHFSIALVVFTITSIFYYVSAALAKG